MHRDGGEVFSSWPLSKNWPRNEKNIAPKRRSKKKKIGNRVPLNMHFSLAYLKNMLKYKERQGGKKEWGAG